MNLPARLYYPLDKAAKKLNCDVSDLIHFGATSSVEICIHLSFHKASCDFELADENNMETLFDASKIYFDGVYNSFKLRRASDGVYINDFYGLAALPPQDLLAFDFLSDTPVSLNQVFCPAGNGAGFDNVIGAVYIEPDEDEVQKVSLNHIIDRLFMTDVEIARLSGVPSNNVAPSLPDIIKKGSSKTRNAQAKFIKSLLQIHYGADVANSPRQHLERKSSGSGIILADFEGKNLHAPSGVAVDSWLKFIDVDSIGDLD
ncbi:hypothetical protein [Hafnia psychrotolerans]|uniref:Uncharacterized protein n=1 Tax=Hafnia psychrotolerans TaxID=1477018 RepID=A0ABQ1H4S4_9GAMM|nr:hypothetical protein [Hafnia psychrotolerans]GGA58195.1 hypothetical protein GCM10011328_37090 [Hafnia psychrotolerans]